MQGRSLVGMAEEEFPERPPVLRQTGWGWRRRPTAKDQKRDALLREKARRIVESTRIEMPASSEVPVDSDADADERPETHANRQAATKTLTVAGGDHEHRQVLFFAGEQRAETAKTIVEHDVPKSSSRGTDYLFDDAPSEWWASLNMRDFDLDLRLPSVGMPDRPWLRRVQVFPALGELSRQHLPDEWTRLVKRYLDFHMARVRLKRRLNREPTPEELGDALDMDPDLIRQLQAWDERADRPESSRSEP